MNKNIYSKIIQIKSVLEEQFAERTDVIDCCLVALLTRTNCLMLGPPGTAKSMIVNNICTKIQGTYFEHLMTRFTVPDEIFGPISIENLKKGKFKRETADMLPQANVAFIDEIWKASSSILNTLLTIINEKKFKNGGTVEYTELESLFGASNEMPESSSLNAMFDRFQLRLVVDYVKNQNSFERMVQQARDHTKFPAATITMSDLKTAQKDVAEVKIPDDILQELVILRASMNDQHVIASDRRYVQSLDLLRAQAYLDGRDTCTTEDFIILQHVLWSQPSERNVVKKLILTTIDPIMCRIQEILEDANDILAKANDPAISGDPVKATEYGVEANVKMKALMNEVKSLTPSPSSSQPLAEAKIRLGEITSELTSVLLNVSVPP